MTLRMFLAVILAVNISTAIASPLCYSVNSVETFVHLEPKLPRTVILEDKPLTGLLAEIFPNQEVKPIDWIDGPDKTQFQGEYGISYWVFHENHLRINIGDGFSGISLALDAPDSEGNFKGIVMYHADVPAPPGTEHPNSDIQLTATPCPAMSRKD